MRTKKLYIGGYSKIEKKNIENKEEVQKAIDLAYKDLLETIKDYSLITVLEDKDTLIENNNIVIRVETIIVPSYNNRPTLKGVMNGISELLGRYWVAVKVDK